MRKTHWMTLLLAAACGPAAAQQVWRCGNSYGQQPCAGGAVLGAGATAPASADAARAAANTKRDAQLADKLEKERLAREARAPKAVIPPEPRPAAPAASGPRAKAKGKKGKDKADHFTAVSPKQGGSQR